MDHSFFKKNIPIPIVLDHEYIYSKVQGMALEQRPTLISIKEYNDACYYGIKMKGDKKSVQQFIQTELLQYIEDHALKYKTIQCSVLEAACLWDSISIGSMVPPKDIIIMDPTKYGQFYVLLRGDKENRKRIKKYVKELPEIVKSMKKMAKSFDKADVASQHTAEEVLSGDFSFFEDEEK